MCGMIHCTESDYHIRDDFKAIEKAARIDQLLLIEWCIIMQSINTKTYSSVLSIKYVIKYTLKGIDQALFKVNTEDEITQYLLADILANQKLWHRFPIHDINPDVM